MRDEAIAKLAAYAVAKGLIRPEEKPWAVNQLLDQLGLTEYNDPQKDFPDIDLPQVLDELLDDAAARGVLAENTITRRDLLDSALLGRLTPRPGQVSDRFWALHRERPEGATDWFYTFSQDVHYIRRDRIARDMRWTTATPYGVLDITINLSKPEKDPREIAAAASCAPSRYPLCQLCRESEGYPGRLDYPGRLNHRVIPLTLGGEPWYFQYSPYVYYNEHAICLSGAHRPMKIDPACFERLLDFVDIFPHYFIGSNADLPIVGGSILSHDHFQGGRHEFAMERAPVERAVAVPGFEDVTTGLVKWPMSVLRLSSPDRGRLAALAAHILEVWRGYSDEGVGVLSHTGDTPHNTITPIARRRNGRYEMDLVLRNNRTTPERPMGLFHPREELHHIKRENIGLIEVMGLAVLPARLKKELAAVAEKLARGAGLEDDPLTAAHARWGEAIRARCAITPDNAWQVVQQATGETFAAVLEDAGVFKRDQAGQEAFRRFVSAL